mmetsp:Transcript_2983/g.9759  ORF Transcript_2983/g.9759 Transcript_2983/m.9759 type:complete len:286 (+) Transcript_2983:395-1252(+)
MARTELAPTFASPLAGVVRATRSKDRRASTKMKRRTASNDSADVTRYRPVTPWSASTMPRNASMRRRSAREEGEVVLSAAAIHASIVCTSSASVPSPAPALPSSSSPSSASNSSRPASSCCRNLKKSGSVLASDSSSSTCRAASSSSSSSSMAVGASPSSSSSSSSSNLPLPLPLASFSSSSACSTKRRRKSSTSSCKIGMSVILSTTSGSSTSALFCDVNFVVVTFAFLAARSAAFSASCTAFMRRLLDCFSFRAFTTDCKLDLLFWKRESRFTCLPIAPRGRS